MIREHQGRQSSDSAQRRALVSRLRAEGRTFKQIGEELGISTSRASQLCARARALNTADRLLDLSQAGLTTSIAMLPLSPRTAQSLEHAGYQTLEEISPLDEHMIRHLLSLPNFGRSCLIEVQAIVRMLTDSL